MSDPPCPEGPLDRAGPRPNVCPDGSIIPLCADESVLAFQWSQGFGDIWTKIP